MFVINYATALLYFLLYGAVHGNFFGGTYCEPPILFGIPKNSKRRLNHMSRETVDDD